jgi:protein-S-isoprenylcysteine O-methyltransferase Ste14
MHIIDQRLAGVLILLLLGGLVIIKQKATGSVLDRPTGNLLMQLTNIFNLFFLLVVNPLAAVLLLTGHVEWIAPTRINPGSPQLLTALEIAGWLIYVAGFAVMAGALIALGRAYQLGGSAPRLGDSMVMGGPYRLIRHPMYAAALSIALGLALLLQSWAFFLVFCLYLVLIFLLIPVEEDELQKAYGASYGAYRQKTKKLIPFMF